jgi:glycosyltransferase involved in cell wall biosynthesis
MAPWGERLVMPSDVQKWPRISVVTPSYNQGQFLGECITSVFRQNYPDLEFIIIDGGSTDESVHIIKENEAYLTFWCSEPDEGQADAINKGLRRATGELVAWLNADDFYLPDALMRVAQAYQQNPHASFYFGDGLRVDENGASLSGFFPEGQIGFSLQALIYGLNCLLQPATFINRAKLIEINYLNPTLHYGLDTDLWIRLAQHTPPSPVTAVLAASREYDRTKTAIGSFKRVEELRQIAEKYGGVAMTPGTLCYFLDTLHRLVQDREDVFPESYKRSIINFWAATSNLLANYGAGPDGFPVGIQHLGSNNAAVKPYKSAFSFLRRIIRKAGFFREVNES